SAAQKLMMQLSKEQEILMNISDMIIETYVAESVLLRVEKLASINGEAAIENQIAIMQVYVYDVADKVNKYGKDAINSFVEGDELRMMQTGLKRFTKQDLLNVKDNRRKVADKLIAENKYCY
ncbi:MAG: acyl-CoA dehydrogenase, partial [Flavobacteriales bacterium]|nr:acyl-CoA dehydrogenase [Flavobacteriales bacterium]